MDGPVDRMGAECVAVHALALEKALLFIGTSIPVLSELLGCSTQAAHHVDAPVALHYFALCIIEWSLSPECECLRIRNA